MVEQTLNFTESTDSLGNKIWKADLVSAGSDIVQVERQKTDNINGNLLLVMAKINDMEPKSLKTDFGSGCDLNQIFLLDMPSGVSITLVSYAEVSKASILQQE